MFQLLASTYSGNQTLRKTPSGGTRRTPDCPVSSAQGLGRPLDAIFLRLSQGNFSVLSPDVSRFENHPHGYREEPAGVRLVGGGPPSQLPGRPHHGSGLVPTVW